MFHLKRQRTSTRLNGVISEETELFIIVNLLKNSKKVQLSL
jgi:hypothetical protein